MKVEIFKEDNYSEIYLPYIPKAIFLIKSIEGRKYETQPNKKWIIPTSQLALLVSLFDQNDIQVVYLTEQRKLNQIKENNSIEIFLGEKDFLIKLPVAKLMYAKMVNIPKRVTETHWEINNEYFPNFFRFCYQLNFFIKLI